MKGEGIPNIVRVIEVQESVRVVGESSLFEVLYVFPDLPPDHPMKYKHLYVYAPDELGAYQKGNEYITKLEDQQ